MITKFNKWNSFQFCYLRSMITKVHVTSTKQSSPSFSVYGVASNHTDLEIRKACMETCVVSSIQTGLVCCGLDLGRKHKSLAGVQECSHRERWWRQFTQKGKYTGNPRNQREKETCKSNQKKDGKIFKRYVILYKWFLWERNTEMEILN